MLRCIRSVVFFYFLGGGNIFLGEGDGSPCILPSPPLAIGLDGQILLLCRRCIFSCSHIQGFFRRCGLLIMNESYVGVGIKNTSLAYLFIVKHSFFFESKLTF